MEHIPRAQPRSCMLLDSCLYVLSMNMFVYTVTCTISTTVAISTCTEDTRTSIFNFAGKEGLYCCIDFAAIVCILFVTLLINSCHHSRILIKSQRARALARALRVWCMHMQIIAVDVTNRRDQQKARFIAFVVPFGQP